MATPPNPMVNSVNQDGKLSGGCLSPLTDSEKEVLLMITEEQATPMEITSRRKTKIQATWKIMRSLRKKGAIGGVNQMVNFSLTTGSPVNQVNQIRLHAQEFNVRLILSSDRYRKQMLDADRKGIVIDGNTVRMFAHAIEVNSGHDFYGEDCQRATAKSMEYWQRFFARLENDLSIILLKPRSMNIKLVNSHYAEVGNELARQTNANEEKIKIYATDDGKLWFTIDNSLNLHEAESLHPRTSKNDMQQVVAPVFNDLRDFMRKTGEKIPLPSEMLAIQYESQRQVLQLTELQLREMSKRDFYAENLKTHVGAIQELRDQVKRLGEAVRSREEVTIKVSSRHRHDATRGMQRSLGEFS